MSRLATIDDAAEAALPLNGVRLHWETARTAGAIAVAALRTVDADSMDRALIAVGGGKAIAIGAVVQRELGGIDDGVIARSGPCCAWLMPHGGPWSCARLREWLVAHGATVDVPSDPRESFPEAADVAEASALHAITCAASSRAVPLLLEQSARFQRVGAQWQPSTDDLARARRLRHLIDPPCIVSVGQANVGKSSLLNALAGRCVAIAFHAPGTTRDAVAAQLTLDGLVADWFDTPGVRDDADALEIAARALLDPLLARAQLLIEVSAPGRPCPPVACAAPRLRVCTHADIDGSAASAEWRSADVAVSCTERTGLDALALAVRRALVPDADIECSRPWVIQPAAPPPKPLGTPTHE